MEKRYKSLSLIEFQRMFPDDRACHKYLADLKWKDCYKCKKCGYTKYCKGIKEFDRQCNKCGRLESPTAGTLFHQCKFSLLKAFYIVFYISASKNGVSSCELSRKLELRQKTCWLFKQKVMKAMESSQNFPIVGEVEVDESYVGGQDDKAMGKNEGKKKIMVVGIERGSKGVSRWFGRVVETASKANLGGFMKDPYINEYTYRFNRHKMKEGFFENLMRRMAAKSPYPYKEFTY